MFYLIDISKPGDMETEYTLYDSVTDSVLACYAELIKELITKTKFKIVNADIIDNKLVIRDWYQNIRRTEDTKYAFTTIAKYGDNKFKTVERNGLIRSENKENLINAIERGMVLNCKLNDNREIDYQDIIEYKEDKDFIKYVSEQYRKYILKSKLLGLDNEFEYEVEGADVKLTKYTGESKEVILPNFITSISKFAFASKWIESVRLNEGLEFIGSHAFNNCDLREVYIPDTVQVIWHQVFSRNKHLKPENIHMNEEKTIVLE